MRDEDDFNSEQEQLIAVRKYERMIRNNQLYFFDTDEISDIIDFYINQNEIDKSYKVLEMALKQHPSSFDINFLKVRILFEQKKYKEVIASSKALFSIDADNFDLLLINAVSNSNLGNSNKAIEIAKSALSCVTEEHELIELTYFLLSEFQKKQKFNEIENLLKEIIENDNYYIQELFEELTYNCINTNRFYELIDYYNGLINKDPYNWVVWYNLALTYDNLSLHEKAINCYDFVIAINDKYSMAYLNKATSQANNDKFSDAINTYKELLEFENPNVFHYYFIAECYEKLELYEKAEEYYLKVIQDDDNFADAFYGISLVNYLQDKFNQSLVYIDKALAIDDENASYYHLQANIFHKLELEELAESAYYKTIELDNSDIDVWLDFADLYLLYDEYEKAFNILLEGIEEHNDVADLFYHIAGVLLLKGDRQEAFVYLMKATKLDIEVFDDFIENFPKFSEDLEVLSYKEK